MRHKSSITIDHRRILSIEDVVRFSLDKKTRISLSSDVDFQEKIKKNRQFCEQEITNGADIYGVTTGFGGSSTKHIAKESALKLQANLTRYHGCGIGPLLSIEQSAAVLLIRLQSNARGYSGVSLKLLEKLTQLADQRLLPAIPSIGSVGASGDLTPLSYIAACLQGERQIYANGKLTLTAETFKKFKIKPYVLQEKEGLALMNGTSVMTGIATLAWAKLKRLADLACSMTGLAIEALDGRSAPFDEDLHALKPHPGQMFAAQKIAAFVASPDKRYFRKKMKHRKNAVQDYYSLRCAPQIIGVLYDVLAWTKTILEIEINSVNDNPVFFERHRKIVNGGQFYGGHISAACDALKTAAANTVGLLERQMLILLDSRFNDALPDNLVDEKTLGESASLHHGFKAMQISMSALTAEILKTSLPGSIFSRSTENHNQDVVSMGTICARDLERIAEYAESAAAIYALALRQAHYLRESDREHELNNLAEKELFAFAPEFKPVVEDRAMDLEIIETGKRLFQSKELIACTR